MKRSLLFGLICSLVGLTVGMIIALNAIGDYKLFPYFSTFSAFSTSFLLWYFFMEKRKNFKISRGVKIGILTSLIAHHLTFYYYLVFTNIEYWIFRIQVGSLNEPPANPLSGFFSISILTLISYLICGWATIPAAGLIGGIFAKYSNQNAKSVSG